jgi:xylulokinase
VKASLGIDLGTSGVKAVVADERLRPLAEAERHYPVSSPQPGWAESDPLVWLSAAQEAASEALDGAGQVEIAGVGIDGQLHGGLLLDARGLPIRPAILWPDTRAEAVLAPWRELPEEDLAKLANPITPGMLGPICAWVRQHEPQAFAKVAQVASAKDWLRAQLLGQADQVTDPTDASATLLWDVHADGWHSAALELAGLRPDQLGALASPGSVAGHTGRAAGAFGLPDGIPVATGCGDVAAAAYGMGLSAGQRMVSLGTGHQVVATAEHLSSAWPPAFHAYRGVDPFGLHMAAPLNGGYALNLARGELGATWEELYAAADYVPGPTTPIFMPYYAPERFGPGVSKSKGWHAAKQVGGWDPALSDSPPDRPLAELLYAVLEGVCCNLAMAARDLPGPAPEVLYAVGGGAREAGYRQLLADAFGAAIQTAPAVSWSALGAARLGFAAAGLAATAELSGGQTTAPGENAGLQERFAAFRQLAGRRP